MNDTFLRACRGESTDYTPVWAMRQAGRYMKEYQAVRGKVDFLTLCKSPELAAEVTFQPVDILGVDAAILFSDILVPIEKMGLNLEFIESRGPVFHDPVRMEKDLERLRVPEPEEELHYVTDTIKILRKDLKIPLIGFSGAPFTLATYMIEGGSSKNYLNTKRMMYEAPALYGGLMEKITETTIKYLRAQAQAGAQALQLFDSWAGVLMPEDFRQHALKYAKRIISELKPEGVPIIYFANNCAGLLEEVKTSGADVLGLDWRMDIAHAIGRLGQDVSVQGNLDPLSLFMPVDQLRARVKDIVEKGRQARGHIFNLGHGVVPETDVNKVKAMVDAVHEFSGK